MKPILRLLLLITITSLLLIVFLSFSPSSAQPNKKRSHIYPDHKDYKNSKVWPAYLSLLRNKPYERIERRSDYCEGVRLYQESHEYQFDEEGMPVRFDRKVFSDYKPMNLVREVINQVATPVFQNHHLLTKNTEEIEPIPYNIDMFIHKTPHWHAYFEIDKEFLCPGQRYNHIPGNDAIIFKDLAAFHAKEYGKKFQGRRHCFHEWSFMPITVNLYEEQECKEFFKDLKATDNVYWILKKARNSHNGEGITVLDPKGVAELKLKYKNGAWCGKDPEVYIAQQYIGNPLTVYNRKFDFRVYMMIANMDPLISMYHDGFLRVSLAEYKQNSTVSNSHITNTHLAKEVLAKMDLTAEEKEEAMKDQMWTFEKFGEYMRSQGLVKGDWINEYVRPVMKKKMLELTLIHRDNLLKHPGVFELFGCDFMFDSDLKLWLLEVNRSPAMQATSEEKGKLQGDMTKDVLDIQYAILHGADLDRVVEKTSFEVIYDERLGSPERYCGVIPDECIPEI
jgi:hypothetical protein